MRNFGTWSASGAKHIAMYRKESVKTKKNKVGAPLKDPSDRRVTLSARIKGTTREKLDRLKADHGGSIGKTIDFILESFQK